LFFQRASGADGATRRCRVTQEKSAVTRLFVHGTSLSPELERYAILESVTSAVEVEDIALSIDEVALLRPTSFSLSAGEALAVTGSNGSGKTTLLRILAGLARPTSGAARIQGSPVDERSPAFRRAVSGSIGRPPVARDLTLEEHLALVAASWGSSVDAARQRAAAELERWQLSALRRRFPHELSSGQSQLFALALAVVRPYEVLVLDEPEQRLDSDRLGVVTEVLRQEIAHGRTVVFATHSAVLSDAVASRVIRLGGGTPGSETLGLETPDTRA
jgi:ABC-2 type transport system ATP-binding protein